ncbi:hypothetical protein F9948_03050 [Burkholderia thailandensis]|nr:hypothetical protein [Burkholderia thailandensis]MDD1485603.1 hypothetical protein [Burkholderia thailandensis]MDD1491232.1 hypothetical protein [Burkholderia thailandensis]PNE74244.1 hypothetical protein A8H37_20650 [Burkholderia thailandensis]
MLRFGKMRDACEPCVESGCAMHRRTRGPCVEIVAIVASAASAGYVPTSGGARSRLAHVRRAAWNRIQRPDAHV